MDENMLLASGAGATRRLYSTAGFFAGLVTQENLDFHGEFARRFGVEAPPLGSLGESCYEGVMLLAALIGQARTLDVRAIGDGRRRGGVPRAPRAAAAAPAARPPAHLPRRGRRSRLHRARPALTAAAHSP